MEELARACVHALLHSGAGDNARGAALVADLFPGAASLRHSPGRAGKLLQLGYLVRACRLRHFYAWRLRQLTALRLTQPVTLGHTCPATMSGSAW
jgi:hypothetical protein